MNENNEVNMNNSVDAVATFVGKNAAYYQNKWQKSGKGGPMGFNPAAFFLGIMWLIYRKMYLYALIVAGLLIVDMVIESYYPLPTAFGQALTWGIAGIFGSLGNTWYKNHTDKKIAAITATFPPEQVPAELAKQGGVNPAAAWGIGVTLVVVVVWALSFASAA
jgi:hypothetical protein